MARYVDCPECEGWGGTDKTCSTCAGAGQILVDDAALVSKPSRSSRLRERFSGKVFVLAGVVALVVLVGLVYLVVQQLSSAFGPGILDEPASETTWRGTYECVSGPSEIAMRLDVEAASGAGARREVVAELWYLDGPGDDVGPDPDSTALGTLVDRELSLLGENPQGAPPFQVQALNATVGPEADVILGQATAESCSTVAVTPVGAA